MSNMVDLHISGIDANLLVALDALLVERSVTRAAERLGLSQSAMSHKLRRLRGLLEDDLLVPGRGGMLTTPRAEALASPLRAAVESLQHALTRAPSFDPLTAKFTHNVMSSDYAELVIMPLVVERARQLAPNLSVNLLQPAQDIAARLADGTAHVYVGRPIQGPGLRRRVLYHERIECAVRADHPAVGDTLDLQTWLELDHVRFAPQPEHTLVDDVLERRGLSRRVVVTTPHCFGGPLVAARTDLVYTGLSAPIREIGKLVPLRVFPLPVPLRPRDAPLAVLLTWHMRYDGDAAASWLREFTARATMDAVAHHGLGPRGTSLQRTKSRV